MKNDHSASLMRAENGFIHRNFFSTGPPDRFNLADQVKVGLVAAFLAFCTPKQSLQKTISVIFVSVKLNQKTLLS